jgi:transcriptional regulator with XRE-family HTH domain
MIETVLRTTSTVRQDLAANFGDKRYRDLFVSEQIFSGLPLKIRKLREAKFPTQKAFADKLGKHQSWVSQLENPNYGKLTLTTLLEVASAFDVALEVDFVAFSRVLDRAARLSAEWFEVPSYTEDRFETNCGELVMDNFSPVRPTTADSTGQNQPTATDATAFRRMHRAHLGR